MKQPVQIRVLGSSCSKTDAYLALVQGVISDLGLCASITKVTEAKEIEACGVTVGCAYGYCPGCNYLKRVQMENQYTPALVVGREVVVHSCFPRKDVVKRALAVPLQPKS